MDLLLYFSSSNNLFIFLRYVILGEHHFFIRRIRKSQPSINMRPSKLCIDVNFEYRKEFVHNNPLAIQ